MHILPTKIDQNVIPIIRLNNNDIKIRPVDTIQYHPRLYSVTDKQFMFKAIGTDFMSHFEH